MNKVLFVGLDNPQSSDPRYALFPRPASCAGHRLLKMMQEVAPDFTEREYVNVPKTNLFPVGRWPSSGGKRMWLSAAGQLLVEQARISDTTLLLLGNDVRDAALPWILMGEKFPPSGRLIQSGGVSAARIPHPSGRCREYSDTRTRRRIARFLVAAVRGET